MLQTGKKNLLKKNFSWQREMLDLKMQKLAEILVFQVDLTRDDVLAASQANTSPPLPMC